MEEFYREYLAERFGAELIVTEAGFIAYELYPTQLYISEFHIGKEYRASGKAFNELMAKLEAIALDGGRQILACRVPYAAKNKEQAIRAHLHYGFKITGADNVPFFTFVKEIGGEK